MAAVIALITIGLNGCIEPAGQFNAIPPGPWRATLDLTGHEFADQAFDERSGGKLPFNFEVIYDTPEDFHIEIINGEERIRLDEITFGRDTYLQKDTILIEFPAYGSYIRAKYEEDAIEGAWYVPDRGEDYSIPFRALHGKTQRFARIDTPITDISGKWASSFEIERDEPYQAIGIFHQDEDGIVTGTIRTATGDYRFLEGKMSSDRLYLSVFDGAHAFLFEAKYLEDGTLSGIFRSGNHYKTYWEAHRDENATLPDPFEQASILPDARVSFAFPNTDGTLISIDDERYQDKPLLVQVMGTWCPNCHDETTFLVDYFDKHPELDIEIVTLAFERFDTFDEAAPRLKEYKEHMDIQHELLYAGSSSKAVATEKLGILDRVVSFPTLVFLDKDKNITRVHSGFNGPATEEYAEFVEKFEKEIEALTTPPAG